MEEVSTSLVKELSEEDLFKIEEEEFYKVIDDGQKGLNVGLLTPIPGLNQYFHGISKGRFLLAGADSGVGKTTFIDFAYVLSAYYMSKKTGIPVDITYYSFEISKQEKKARWLSFLIYQKHGVRINSEVILGKNFDKKLTDSERNLVDQTLPELNQLMRSIRFIEEPIHPTAIFHDLIENARKHGTIHESTTHKKNSKGKMEKKTRLVKYVPNDPRQIKLFVIDHISLLSPEAGNDTKKNMDRMSSYCVYLRNRLGYSPIIIQQFNTGLASIERQKFKKGALAPQRIDFSESSFLFRDAEYVLGLLKPNSFDLDEYNGYDVEKFKDHLIMCFLMKNRYGVSNKVLPLFMDGELGIFTQLPKPDEKQKLQSYYEKAKQLDNGNKSS